MIGFHCFLGLSWLPTSKMWRQQITRQRSSPRLSSHKRPIPNTPLLSWRPESTLRFLSIAKYFEKKTESNRHPKVLVHWTNTNTTFCFILLCGCNWAVTSLLFFGEYVTKEVNFGVVRNTKNLTNPSQFFGSGNLPFDFRVQFKRWLNWKVKKPQKISTLRSAF